MLSSCRDLRLRSARLALLAEGAILSMGNDEGSNLSLSLRPDSAAGTKPFDKAPILHGGQPKPELAHPAFADETLDFGEERGVHEQPIARFSVWVKRPDKTCVPQTDDLLVRSMSTAEWDNRLRQAIKEHWTDHGRSLTELGRAIGMGQNYVSEMLSKGKAPRAQAVINLAQVLGVSLTWIYLGVEMTAEDEQLLQVASKVDATQKRRLLDLLNSIASETP